MALSWVSVERFLASAGLASCLVSCGGGGADPLPASSDPPGVTAEASLRPDVKVDSGASVVLPQTGSANFPDTASYKTGDIVIVGSQAIKLGGEQSGAAPGRVQFETAPPRLDEVYSSLVLSGRVSATPQSADSGFSRPLAVPTCLGVADIAGLTGTKCTVEFKSEIYPVVALSGTVAAGARMDFKHWMSYLTAARW